jgi:phosphoribosyl 1,2-cyclic phosphodiesterase
MNPGRLAVKFWGVRGSFPTPYGHNLGFGGNTACVEIESSSPKILILDAGSGIRELGVNLISRSGGEPLDIHICLTHFHWDHVLGLPFFVPLFSPKNSITFYSSRYSMPLRPSIEGVFAAPYFPVQFDTLPSKIRMVELDSDLELDGLRVHPFPVCHPQGACGYRVEGHGSAVVYVPDREPRDAALNRTMREQCHGADLLIHDGQYTTEEYPSREGWGHSTWKEAVEVAKDAQVKHLVLFHHDPSHSDEVVEGIVERAREAFPRTDAAREGWEIEFEHRATA